MCVKLWVFTREMFAVFTRRPCFMLFLAVMLLLPLTSAHAQEFEEQWVDVFDGPVTGTNEGVGVGITAGGHIVSGLNSAGSGTGLDFLAILYRPDGLYQDFYRFNEAGTVGDDQAVDMALDASDNIVMTGHSMGDRIHWNITTVKWDVAGNLLWAAIYDGPGNFEDDTAAALSLDSVGNVHVVGTASVSGTSYAVTLKYDPDGDLLWSRVAAISSTGKDLAMDSVGNVLVLTSADTIKYDLDGDEIWSNGIGSDAPVGLGMLPDDGYYLAGTEEIAWYDADGVCETSSTFPLYIGTCEPNDLLSRTIQINGTSMDLAGNVFAAGWANERCCTQWFCYPPPYGCHCNAENTVTDPRAALFAPDGTRLWTDENHSKSGDATLIGPDGDYIVVGKTTSLWFGTFMLWVWAYDVAGNLLWSTSSPEDHDGYPTRTTGTTVSTAGIAVQGDAGLGETEAVTAWFQACTGCYIGQVCYGDGEHNPNNDCAVCDLGVSRYVWTFLPDGASCEDGLFCNGVDTCQSGSCVYSGNPCPDDGLYCNGTESCDEIDDECDHSGNPCTDNGQWCDGEEVCNETDNLCETQNVPDCDDGIVCTDDSCNETTDICDNLPNHTLCDDSDVCTSDTCSQSTGCNHIIDKDSDTDGYIDGSCLGGTDCDDMNPDVNPGETEGPYGHGTCSDTFDNDCDGSIDDLDTECLECLVPAECDDLNSCTDDDCVDGGCINTNNTDLCDDGNSCTQDDVCLDGICSGSPLDADSDGHVSDVCGGGDCDDGNPAVNPSAVEGPYGDDTCSDTFDNDCDGSIDDLDTGCQECSIPDDCDDLNPCTDDACVAGACENTNNSDQCDDGNTCTTDDVCSDGICSGDPLDEDGDTYVSETCPGGTDCDDDPGDDPPICASCSCGTIECAGCAACIHPGALDWSNDGFDSDCNPAIPNWGPTSSVSSIIGASKKTSDVSNHILYLFVPLAAVLFLKARSRKK